jgi:hypothetical protein
MALSQSQLSKKRAKKAAKAKARKAKKENNMSIQIGHRIDDKFMANCHSLFHQMYDDNTIDFTKAPYDIWLHGLSFHQGKAIDLDKTWTIDCVTSGTINDTRLDPVKLVVRDGYVEFQTRKQSYRMNVQQV